MSEQQPPPPPGGQPPPPPPPQPPPPAGGQPPQYGEGGGYPPPPGPYSGGPPGGGGYSIGDAFNYGWAKFQQNVGPILIAMLVYLVVVVALSFGWQLIVNGLFLDSTETTTSGGVTFSYTTSDVGFFGFLLVSAVGAIVYMFLVALVQAAIVRGALSITYGRPLELKTLFATDGLGRIIVASLLVGLMVAVGVVLCFIPGLVVAFFTLWTNFFVIDKQMSPIDAIKASFSFTNKSVGTLVGFVLATWLALLVGAILCGIGLLVAFPVVVIAQAYTYRRLQGEAVAA